MERVLAALLLAALLFAARVNNSSADKPFPWRRLSVHIYRGFSRDVTRSRACLVTPLIRHFGGQASAAVCVVCALQCAVHTS